MVINSKYKAKKIVIDGIKFDSKKEASVYQMLKLQEKSKDITELQRQVHYTLCEPSRDPQGKAVRKIEYIADFVYRDHSGKLHVVDVKGCRKGSAYAMFVVKKKLMWSRNHIWV